MEQKVLQQKVHAAGHVPAALSSTPGLVARSPPRHQPAAAIPVRLLPCYATKGNAGGRLHNPYLSIGNNKVLPEQINRDSAQVESADRAIQVETLIIDSMPAPRGYKGFFGDSIL